MSETPASPVARLGRLRAALRGADTAPAAARETPFVARQGAADRNAPVAATASAATARQAPRTGVTAGPGDGYAVPVVRDAPSAAGIGTAASARAASGAALLARVERLATTARRQTSAARPGQDAGRFEPRLGDAALAEHLGGQVCAPGVLGFTHEEPLDRCRGLAALASLPEVDLQWLGLAPPDLAANDLCFIDTETTGLAGGCGTLPFLVGTGRLHGRVLRIRQWLLTGFTGERAMLQALREQVAGTSAWASYNGKSFDLPLLETRLALARLAPFPAGRAHADLLHAVRVAFGQGWPDCRLGTAETRLLGMQREADLPGHAVPATWSAFVREGAIEALPAVLLHNRLDLLSLAALLPALAAIFEAKRPPHDTLSAAAHVAADRAAIARAQVRRGRTASALRQFEGSHPSRDPRARLLHADLLRREGRAPEACVIWEDLAAGGVVPAVVALLRHHRGAGGDARMALAWARRLCALEPTQPRHRRRLERLARALARPASLALPGLEDAPKK